MLVGRWRILNDRMDFSVGKCVQILFLAMNLRNYCVEKRERTSRVLGRAERVAVEYECEEWYRSCKDDFREEVRGDEGSGTEGNASVSKKRDMLIDIIRKKGLHRPSFAGDLIVRN